MTLLSLSRCLTSSMMVAGVLSISWPGAANAQSCTNLISGSWWQKKEHWSNKIGLIDRCSVHITDGSGNTPLHYATTFNDHDLARRLINKGANPNIANDKGSTPFHYAAQWGDSGMVKALLDIGANPNAVSKKYGASPLHFAMSNNGFNGVTRELLAAGAQPNARDAKGNTPLLILIGNDKETRWKSERLKSVRTLIRHGADVNLVNDAGQSALLLAHTWGDLELYELLFSSRADPGRVASDGSNALHYALKEGRFRRAELSKIVRLLLQFGTNPDQADKDGDTALHLAANTSFPEVVRSLLELDADPALRNNAGQTPHNLGAGNDFLIGSQELQILEKGR